MTLFFSSLLPCLEGRGEGGWLAAPGSALGNLILDSSETYGASWFIEVSREGRPGHRDEDEDGD